MKRTFSTIIFILITISLLASPETIINNLKNRYLNFTTFEADIIQTNYFSDHEITLESKGSIFWHNDTIVLEYTEPVYQFKKSDNTSLILYFARENTAIVSTGENPVTHTILHFSNLLNQDFEYYGRRNDKFIFTVLSPIDKEQNIRLYINQSESLIETITYKDEFENTISITLQNQRFNQPLSKSVESFVIPQGTSIIQN